MKEDDRYDDFYESKPWLKFYDDGVPESIEYPDINAFELLSGTASKMPGKTALVYHGKEVKYGELLRYSENLASYLYSTLGEEEKVMLVLPNSPQYVIGYYAILRANCIVVPDNPLSTEAEMTYKVKDAGVKAVITLDIFYPKVRKVCEELGVENIIVSKAQDFVLPPSDERLEHPKFTDLINQSGDLPSLNREVNKTAALLYTGGTTGVPKGVELTHYNIVVNAYQVRSWIDVNKNDRVVAALPLFHGYGMSVLMNCTILSGGSAILMPRFSPEDFLKIVETYRPTIFAGVPTMYIALLNYPDLKKYDLSCFRGCFVGAAPLPLEVKRRWEEVTKATLMEGYGLTEAVTAQCCNPLKGVNKEGSIGVPFPDVIFKIVDIETGTKAMPVGEPGELIIKSPSVMKGYYNREEETKSVIRNGWLYTGDIAYMDEDGFFYIVERKKDLIIVGGFNVYPKEVEDVLYKHPKVMEAAVVGVPDEYRGEVVKAFVVLKHGVEETEQTKQEIIEFCSKYLSKYKVPKYVEFKKSLPKSPIGKILRRALREETPGGMR
jgi:long-chain acyl-CoA synthetase